MNITNGTIIIIMHSLVCGGAETQFRHIVDYFSKHGAQVHVMFEFVSSADSNEAQCFMTEHSNVKFTHLSKATAPDGKTLLFEESIRCSKIMLKVAWNFLVDHNDKTMLVYTKAGILLIPVAKLFKKRVLYSERNSGENTCRRWIYRFCITRCDVLFANSTYAKKCMSERGYDVKYIPNGVRLSPRLALPSQQSYEYDLLIPARIDPVKNQALVLEMLKNTDMKLRVAFAGGFQYADYEKQLRNTAASLSEKHNIVFLGRVQDMDALYNRSKLVILPSLSEGTPNVVLESYARMKICLASNIPMIEAIAQQPEWLFDPADAGELEQKVRTYLDKDERALAQALEHNYNFVRDEYSIDRMADAYLRVALE